MHFIWTSYTTFQKFGVSIICILFIKCALKIALIWLNAIKNCSFEKYFYNLKEKLQ